MAMALPQFVVLRSNSNSRYLCPVVADSRDQAYGSLQFSGQDVFAPHAKCEVEAAPGGLVHIRSCYNNKYWAKRAERDNRIVARAREPETDSSQWSCTLFKAVINMNARTVRFFHVQLRRYLSVMPSSEIAVSLSQTDPGVECVFIDGGSLFMLPKHVAFKGDNNRYLIARPISNLNCFRCITGNNVHNYLQFKGEDIGDQAVRNDIEVTDDGFVRIKSMSHGDGRFWRRDPKANWIWADSDNNDPSGNDLFWPVKTSRDKSIALRTKGNRLFCRRYPGNTRKDCLRAAAAGMIKEAYLEVEETVVLRSIHNVQFRITDVKIQERGVDLFVSNDIVNNGPTVLTKKETISYSKTRRSTWSSSTSLKLGVGTHIKATVPHIHAQLDISGEVSRTIKWGEEDKETDEIATTVEVTVPPMTTVNVIVTATLGSFEVPFSYNQSDTLTNGEPVYHQKDDGVYFHEKYFNFKTHVEPKNAIQNAPRGLGTLISGFGRQLKSTLGAIRRRIW